MLTMTQEGGGIDVVDVSGVLTKADYDRFVPAFERLAGPRRLLIRLDDFRGWGTPALWEDLKFDATHQGDMGRIAIVGDRAWQDWGTTLSKPFFRAGMRYFDRDREADARAWLTGP
ncbi:MAG: STAS/SEC14 domain-containing protein [Geminicoccaceae bacterium]|nr:STAS/SEC14 domain-containing protein [Geminicoccaceae bacterium]